MQGVLRMTRTGARTAERKMRRRSGMLYESNSMDIDDTEAAQLIWMMLKLDINDTETSQDMECDAF